MKLELPYPPSVNHYYLRRGAMTFIGAKGRKFREAVGWKVIETYGMRVRPLTCPVEVFIRAYPPDKRKRDIDNTIKILLDSLQRAGVFEDDNQINKLTIERMEVVKGGKVIVEINARTGN